MGTTEAHVTNTDVDRLCYSLSPRCLIDMCKESNDLTEMGKDLGVRGLLLIADENDTVRGLIGMR